MGIPVKMKERIAIILADCELLASLEKIHGCTQQDVVNVMTEDTFRDREDANFTVNKGMKGSPALRLKALRDIHRSG